MSRIIIPESTRSEVIEKYQSGSSISAIQREMQIPRCRIEKILREGRVTIRGGRKKIELTTEQKQLLKQMVEEKKSWVEIAEVLQIDKLTCKRIVFEEGWEKENTNPVNNRLKIDYFSAIDSQDKAYWLGFLYTDGTVDEKGRVRIQLQPQDKEILEQYKKDLQIDSHLYEDKREGKKAFSVEFQNQTIANDLIKLGVIPNKTYKSHHLPVVPEQYIPAFCLGLLDGDGSVLYNEATKEATINFTSYYESNVEDFQLLIDKLINKPNHNKNFFTSAWHTQWRGRQQCLRILDILYSNCNRHLNRKYQTYLKMKL